MTRNASYEATPQPQLLSLRGALRCYFWASVLWVIVGAVRLKPWGTALGAIELAISARLLWSFGSLSPRKVSRVMSLSFVTGLTLLSLIDGQSRSISLWTLAAIPILAAGQQEAGAAPFWGAVCMLAMVGVHASERFISIPPEDPPTLVLVVITQAGLLGLLTYFGVAARRANDDQWRLLELQASNLGFSRDVAVAAFDMQARFLAMMSHEVRTPLNGVLGLAAALEASQVDDEQRDWIRTIGNSGELLLRIVDDILDFSKLESEQLPLMAVPFDVESVLVHPADLLADQAWAKGIDLAVRILPDTPRVVVGDPLRVEQILLNLLSNAVKFTRAGQVVLSAGPHPDGLVMEVSDTGIGIDPGRVQQLFQPYRQDNESISRRFGGTGLGLTISRKLARLMGGDVTADCKYGKGSVFRFTLPTPVTETWTVAPPCEGLQVRCVGVRAATRDMLSQVAAPVDEGGDWCLIDSRLPDFEERLRDCPHPRLLLTSRADDLPRLRRLGFEGVLFSPLRIEAVRRFLTGATHDVPRPPSVAPPPQCNQTRILVVEDNAVNQKVARLMLQRLGHKCDVVQNGLEGVEAVLGGDYDLVFMDIHMPTMDGLEATRRIRAERGPHPRIVVLTADVLWEQREAARVAGADGFLAKPIVLRDLEAAIKG